MYQFEQAEVFPPSVALLNAAHRGDEAEVRVILGSTAAAAAAVDLDLNARDVAQNTALVCAARKGHDPVVTLLLGVARERGLDPNLPGELGATPLFFAAREKRTSTVALLLADERVDPNVPNWSGSTALHNAARVGHASMVALLMDTKRVDPNVVDKNGDTPVTAAAPDLAVLRRLLASDRTDRRRPSRYISGKYYDAALAWADRQGTDAEAAPQELLPAAAEGDAAMVASALRNPLTDPNMTDPGDPYLTALPSAGVHSSTTQGWTALMFASNQGRTPVVRVLLASERVDPNVADPQGKTALSFAARRRNLEILKLLLADERTARVRPVVRGTFYDAAVAWLARRGTGAEAAPEELLVASQKGNAATVASALRNPLLTDPNSTDDEGWPALLWAVRNNNAPVVKLLLADERVDPDASDRNGFTALLIAANCGVVSPDGHVTYRTKDLGRGYDASMLKLLLADHRTSRTRPVEGAPYDNRREPRPHRNFDAALRAVKCSRHARFKGLVRTAVAFRRMRFRAAEAVYAPGGAGFAAAAASFNTSAAAAAAAAEG